MIPDSNPFKELQEYRAQIGELSTLPESQLLEPELQTRVKEIVSKALSLGEQIKPQSKQQLREHIGEYRTLASDIASISQKIQSALLTREPSTEGLSLELLEHERLLKSLSDRLEVQCNQSSHESGPLNEEANQVTAAEASKDPVEIQSEKKLEAIRKLYERKQIVFRVVPLNEYEESERGILPGDLYSNALTYFKNDIQFFEEFLDADPAKSSVSKEEVDQLVEMKRALADAAGYACDIEIIRDLLSSLRGDLASLRFESLISQIQERVLNLKEGEFFIIPGGTGRHAIAYKLTRTHGDEYSFELFNTGEGALEYCHEDFAEEEPPIKNEFTELVEKYGVSVPLLKQDHTISLKWEGCKLASLLDSGFLRDQISSTLVTPPLTVYELLESQLKYGVGRPVCSTPYRVQVGGSCSYSSLLACAKGSLSSPVYHSLHLFLMRRAITKIHIFQDRYLDRFASDSIKYKDRKIKRKLKKWSALANQSSALADQSNARMNQLTNLSQRVLAHVFPAHTLPTAI